MSITEPIREKKQSAAYRHIELSALPLRPFCLPKESLAMAITKRYLGISQDDKNKVYLALNFTG